MMGGVGKKKVVGTKTKYQTMKKNCRQTKPKKKQQKEKKRPWPYPTKNKRGDELAKKKKK